MNDPGQCPENPCSCENGVPAGQSASPGTLPSYLGRSVLILMVGINCCGIMTAAMSAFYWLLALAIPPAAAAYVAIIHGIRVGDRETTGDHPGALESSESAQKWSKIARHLMWPGLGTLFVLFIIEGFRMMS